MKLADLFVKLGLKNDQFNKEVDKSKKKTKSFGKSVKAIGGAIAGAFAIGKVVSFFKESFRLYGIQEDAERKLRSQIEANGKAATSTLNDYKKFASELQSLTTVGDEATLKLLQVAESMGATTKQAKEATKGAIGLSKAFGISIETALRGAILAQQGQFEMLQRYIPALRTANSDVEKSAILQKAMADGFKVATAEAETSIGALQQVANSWGDIKESIGKAIGESKLFKSALNEIKSIMRALGNDVESTGAENLFKSWEDQGLITTEFLKKQLKTVQDQVTELSDSKLEILQENKLEDIQKRFLGMETSGDILNKQIEDRLKLADILVAKLKEQEKIDRGKAKSIEEEIRNESFLTTKIDEYKEKSKTATGSIRADINDRIKALEAEKKALENLSNVEIDRSKTATSITATSITDTPVSKDSGKLTTKGTLGEDIVADQKAKQEQLLADQMAFNQAAASLAADFVTDTVTVFAEGIGEMFSGDFNVGEFGKALLKAVGGFLSNLGKMMIQFGATALVYSILAKALSNPVTAGPAAVGMIAAGAALVAIGSAISSASSGGGASAGGGAITTIDTRGARTQSTSGSLQQTAVQPVTVEVVGRIDNKVIALSNNQGQQDLRR